MARYCVLSHSERPWAGDDTTLASTFFFSPFLRFGFIFVYVEKTDAAGYKSFAVKILGYSRCISIRINTLHTPLRRTKFNLMRLGHGCPRIGLVVCRGHGRMNWSTRGLYPRLKARLKARLRPFILLNLALL